MTRGAEITKLSPGRNKGNELVQMSGNVKFCSGPPIVGGSVGGVSVECRWSVGGVSVECRWSVGGVSVECRWSVGEVSVECRWSVGEALPPPPRSTNEKKGSQRLKNVKMLSEGSKMQNKCSGDPKRIPKVLPPKNRLESPLRVNDQYYLIN
jgi:hypothetical protein